MPASAFANDQRCLGRHVLAIRRYLVKSLWDSKQSDFFLFLLQTKPGVISSVSGLNLGKGPLQIQVVGKGLPQLVPSVPMQGQQLVSVHRHVGGF